MSKKLNNTSKKSPNKPVKKVAAKKVVKAKPVKKEAAKKGRKPIDVDDLLVQIYYTVPKGLNDAQLSAFLGISETSYYEIKATNSDFAEAIKFYRKLTAIEVLKSFKKIAVGYDFDEVKKERRKNQKTGEYEIVTTEVITKHVSPNATAGIFILKNQMSEHFKDKVEQVHSFTGDMENITFIVKARE